ncbi:MAG: uroporphyrinogen-III C-methyltransferase [Pseudonocardia sp.]|nr:uroporphyrinogen-III C-methyltransferase [Pseudonocardia sp.]
MNDPYLAGLDLGGRRVVVVGGGTVAQRRVTGLLAAGADVEVVAPALTPAIEGMASAGELRLSARPYRDGDLDGAWYAIACTDSAEVNAAVAAEAERRRIFCVRADDAPAGSAVTPAVGRHDGLTVGVLAQGLPRRSAAVRTALVEALQAGVVDDSAEPVRPGVALVGGGPGDPELITVRGRRLLARADVVVTDRLGPRDLLDQLAPHVEVIDASKIPYGRAMNQTRINELLISHARAGRFVVRLKGGDPYVFGRGFEEVIACAGAGVEVTVVPGVTSAFAAPAVADVPVSHRGVAHEIVVVSGHVAPGDPRSLVDWPALGRLRGTVVLLMAVERVGAFATALIDGGRPADTPVAVVQDGTMRIQRSVRATLSTVAAVVAEHGIAPPAVVVVGPVAGLSRPAEG